MLLALKFQGELASLESAYARRALRELHARVEREHGISVDFGQRGPGRIRRTRVEEGRAMAAGIGCAIAAVMGAGLMLVGLVTVVRWLL
jgi:hypothetical protein